MSICILCPYGHPVLVAARTLGSEVVCPRCLAPFLAVIQLESMQHARAEKGKARKSRDDDDDDDEDEDEKPVKKAKPKPSKTKKKADEEEEDDDDEAEKPAKKAKKSDTRVTSKSPAKGKKAKSADDDEDDEEEEEEDDEPEDEEEPIEWTARKRQLNVCSFGLVVMMVSFYLLIAFAAFTLIAIAWFEILEDYKKDPPVWQNGPTYYIFYFAALPFIYLATAGLMASMVISFAVPAKAEARAGILSCLVFGGLVFLLAVLLILTKTQVIVTDELREKNMSQLLAGGSMLCFAICLVSAMGYMSKLLSFMKMQMEASQPITNAAFIILGFIGLVLVVTVFATMAKTSIGDWMSWVILAACAACSGFAIYMVIMHVQLIQKLCGAIQKYIRDA